jgi:WD40 repeat protein
MTRGSPPEMDGQGGNPVSDDKPSRAEQHLINEARKRQARQPQPQPPGMVTVKRVGRFNGMTSNVHWLTQAWSPDGKQLAYGGAQHNGHGRLHLWHGDSGHDESFTVRHITRDLAGPVIWLDWAPDSKHLASVEREQASGEPVVRIRSQAEGVRQVQLPPGLPVKQVAWSPDGGTLAVTGPDCQGTVLIDAASGTQRRVLDNLSGPVAWQPDGRLIAGVFETSVLLCDPATGGRTGRLAGQERHPAALAWDRRGKHLAVSDGERILVWDAAAGTMRWRLPWTTVEGDRGPDGTVGSMQWLDGGGYLMEFRPRGGAWHDEWGTTVATVIVWDIESGQAVFVELFFEHEQGRRQPVAGVSLSPDGRRLALAVDFIPPVIWKIDGDLPHFIS